MTYRTDQINWMTNEARDLVTYQPPEATTADLLAYWKETTDLPEWWTNHDDDTMTHFIDRMKG